MVVAVASAGAYANHLRLAPDKSSCQHLITEFFYWPYALPGAQPTVSNH